MPYQAIDPEEKQCPQCGTTFEVGGRGRGRRDQIYCSRHCYMLARPPIANPGSHAPRPKKYKDTLHDEAWLRARYVDERLSTTEIGALLGCPRATVKWALAKWGIPARSGSEARNLLYDRRGRIVTSKAEMVAAYGGKCACCGEIELAFLSLDHTDGGGKADRARAGGGRALLQELKAAGWPTAGYRVLCMNCQFGTRYGRVCPHKRTSLN